MKRSWTRWFPAVCLVGIFAATAGCHCFSHHKKANQCDCDVSGCPQSPYGAVNEEEKGKCKMHLNALIDSRINRDGCAPENERLPLLKRIADKANLESENPVIKAAAKIKREEDLCQQKIKAVKYLGKLGCGCYDKDNQVSEALLAALDDCLPAVRLTAVQAIGGCVCDEPVSSPLCCTPEIAERLYEMAYKTDEYGMPVEPVDQIRQWAAYVYNRCPRRPDTDKMELKPDKPIIEGGEGVTEDPSKEADPNQKTDQPDSTSIPPQPGTFIAPQPQAPLTKEPIPPRLAPRNSAGLSQPNTLIGKLRSPDPATRLEAIRFMAKAHRSGFPFLTEAPDLQGESALETLKDLAFGVDESNQLVEPEELNREAATQVVQAIDPVYVESLYGGQLQTAALGDTSSLPLETAVQSQLATQDTTTEGTVGVVKFGAKSTRTSLEEQQEVEPTIAPPPPVEKPRQIAQPMSIATPKSQPERHLPKGTSQRAAEGIVEDIDLANHTALIRLSKQNLKPMQHARVLVHHNYALGKMQSAVEFEIVDVALGVAVIQPVNESGMNMISKGDRASVLAE